jgi:hypothetical protein
MSGNLAQIFEDEWYLVRYSGETPEIALHSAIYYLTRAKDGPQVSLSKNLFDQLRQAAVERFSEIVLRDLQHANSATQAYRGINRSIINYRRFCTFCQRQNVDPGELRRQTADALQTFLTIELLEAGRTKRLSIINCTYRELRTFAEELEVDLTCRFEGISALCLSAD